MINVAIVEDEQKHAEILKSYLEKYGEEHKADYHIELFGDGLDIVEGYDDHFDIIFLDIQMRHLDGMTAAKKIRELDSSVVLIFITSTVQYAVQGYSVDALGYVLKPVPYVAFSQLVEKAMGRIESKRKKNYIGFSASQKQVKLDVSRIIYIESQRNNVLIHTKEENYLTAGPLKRYEEQLAGMGFSKCHSAYVVNLSFVSSVRHEELVLTNGVTVPISRARKKDFMRELTEGII